MIGDATKPLQDKLGELQRSLDAHMNARTRTIVLGGVAVIFLTAIRLMALIAGG